MKRRKVTKAKAKDADDEDAPAAKKPRKAAAPRKKACTLDPDAPPTPPRVVSPWKVGAHVSAAGGVHNAVLNASKIGANAFALFLKSQRKWTSPALSPLVIDQFKKLVIEHGFDPKKDVLPHGSYLINLGNPDPEKRAKSMECFVDDLKRCGEVGVRLYNFHPGSSVGHPSAVAIQHIIDSLNEAHKLTPDSDVVTVLENMAGAGNVIGGRFEDIGEIVRGVERKDRVGVCLDTCHMYAAGYDIRTKQGWDDMLAGFDKHIGLKYLVAMHLNDSKEGLGSKKDRHENIGLGHIGLAAFYHIVNDTRTQGIPLILETPTGEREEVWETEIRVLNELSRMSVVDGADGVEGVGVTGGVDGTKGAEGEEDVDMQLLETNVEKIRGVAKVGGNEGKKVKPTAKGKGKKTAKDVGEDEDEGDDDAQEELGKSGKAESGVRSAKRSGGVKKEKEVKAKGKPRRVKKEKEEGAACASHGEEE